MGWTCDISFESYESWVWTWFKMSVFQSRNSTPNINWDHFRLLKSGFLINSKTMFHFCKSRFNKDKYRRQQFRRSVTQFNFCGVCLLKNVLFWYDLSKNSKIDYNVIEKWLRNHHSLMSNWNSVALVCCKGVSASKTVEIVRN